MEKPKISFVVEKIENVGNTKGSPLLRILIRSGGKLYKKVAKKSSYQDEYKRKSIHDLWIKEFKEIVGIANESEEDKKKGEKVLADLIRTKIESEDVEE